MGLLDSVFGGGAPEYHAPQLNQETAKAVESFKKSNLAETPESIAAKSMEGVGDAAQTMKSSESQVGQREAAMGGYNSGNMGAALASKYNALTKQSTDKLKQMAQYAGYGKQFSHTQEEAGYSLTMDNFARQNANMAREAQFTADAARNSVISSLLGVAGAAGGMALAGKPAAPSGGSGPDLSGSQRLRMPTLGGR